MKNLLKEQLLLTLIKNREICPEKAVFYINYEILNNGCEPELQEYFKNNIEVFKKLYSHIEYGPYGLDYIEDFEHLLEVMKSIELKFLLSEYISKYEEINGYLNTTRATIGGKEIEEIIEMIKRG